MLHRPVIRTLVVSLAILLVLALAALAFQPKKLKKAGEFSLRSHQFKNYQDRRVPAEFGWLAVPSKRDIEDAPLIKLPFIRLRTPAQTPGTPVFYLSGGPGDSGLEDAAGQTSLLLLRLLESRDVVVFDQRGTGRAVPNLALKGRFDLPLDQPLDSPQSRQSVEALFRRIGESVKKKGIDPNAYTTLQSAHDVDDLRQALGYPKIDLVGFSYGTHLALAVLKYHPDVVERAVLLGPNGLDQRWRRPQDSDETLRRLAAFIEGDPRRRAAFPDFLDTLQRVLQRLEGRPARVSLEVNGRARTVVIGRLDLQVYLALISGNTWQVTQIPRLIAEADSGDFRGIARGLVDVLKRRQIGTAMTYLMASASGASEKRRAEISNEIPGSLLGDAINYPFSVVDSAGLLGVQDLGQAFRAPFRSDVPALLVSGELDGRTSLRDAEEVRSRFTQASHVVVQGAAHNFLSFSRRTLDLIDRFLNGQRIEDQRLTRSLGRFDLAVPYRDQVVAEFMAETRREGIDAGLKYMDRLIADPDRYVGPYLASAFGGELFREEKYEEAAKAYRWAIEAFPDSAFLQLNAAICYFRIAGTRRGREIDARNLYREHYRRFREMNPFGYMADLE